MIDDKDEFRKTNILNEAFLTEVKGFISMVARGWRLDGETWHKFVRDYLVRNDAILNEAIDIELGRFNVPD